MPLSLFDFYSASRTLSLASPATNTITRPSNKCFHNLFIFIKNINRTDITTDKTTSTLLFIDDRINHLSFLHNSELKGSNRINLF